MLIGSGKGVTNPGRKIELTAFDFFLQIPLAVLNDINLSVTGFLIKDYLAHQKSILTLNCLRTTDIANFS